MSRFWHLVWFNYHRVLCRLLRREGGFQSHRFMHHRNRRNWHEQQANQ